jgi:hypothetical protein
LAAPSFRSSGELSARKIDATCEFTNHIRSSAIDQTLPFLKERGIPLEVACEACQKASHAHNREETPKVAKSIERRALGKSPVDSTRHAMKVLFIISSSETAFWLSEVTNSYWHFTEPDC